MQLIVLGMHRSGTSAVARILNLMGAYFAAEGLSNGWSGANKKGYWERKDVLEVNNNTLQALGCSWQSVTDFSLKNVDKQTRKAFDESARAILFNLDAHRPWFIKDPRLCLVFPLWKRLLECPVVVVVYRNPIQVAQSLNARYGYPIHFGIALWEYYNLQALNNARDIPRILVQHQLLLSDPIGESRKIFDALSEIGVSGLRMPSPREITAFIDPKLFRQRGDASSYSGYLNNSQRDLISAFEAGTALNQDNLPPFSSSEDLLLGKTLASSVSSPSKTG